MGAKDWHSLDQLAKNSTIQVTRLSRSSSSCHRAMWVNRKQEAGSPAPHTNSDWAEDTHIYGLIAEVLDILRSHVKGWLAGHQEHCNNSNPESSAHLE